MAADERPSKRQCSAPTEDDEEEVFVSEARRRAAVAAANTPFDALVNSIICAYELEECYYCGETERLQQCATCHRYACQICALAAVRRHLCETCGEISCEDCILNFVCSAPALHDFDVALASKDFEEACCVYQERKRFQ